MMVFLGNERGPSALGKACLFMCRRRIYLRADRKQAQRRGGWSSAIPAVSDLVEHAAAEALRGAGDSAPPERAIKFHCGVVVGKRPDHQALHPALRKVTPCGGE